ncbi:hypothetical protein CW712_01520 [Candidatus Bathyarchaeota archaeon]|nr:MAG: hypothetical protein CW712_01520 [Candidatus Bathyarchaeota archaeon]
MLLSLPSVQKPECRRRAEVSPRLGEFKIGQLTSFLGDSCPPDQKSLSCSDSSFSAAVLQGYWSLRRQSRKRLKRFYVSKAFEVLSEGTEITASEQTLERLYKERDALRTERENLNSEARKWAEKRDRFHEEIRRNMLEAKSLKAKRDELNAEIQYLKALRDEQQKTRREKLERMKQLKQKIRELRAEKSERTFRFLENDLQKVEWKIQTETLTLDEERKLVERAKFLETQLKAYREIERIKKEIESLKQETAELKTEILEKHRRIQELAQESQRFHEKMITKLEKTKELKSEADKMHGEYVKHKEKAKATHLKYVEVQKQIKTLHTAMQKKEEEEKARQQAILRKKTEEEALDKLKRGKKLSFEEFKILAEQGKI